MTQKKDVLRPQLWTPRPVAETIAVYADWADTYDAEVGGRGYRTPARIASALADLVAKDAPILDFGCGTGLSGHALSAAGFTAIDGTDITAQMLDKAVDSGLYRHTWLSQPDELSFGRGTYQAIVAAGVVSLGAAPPQTLAQLTGKLSTGGICIFSYNDPTLADQSYLDALADEIAAGRAEVVFRAHGPHLDDIGMQSDVIALRRL